MMNKTYLMKLRLINNKKETFSVLNKLLLILKLLSVEGMLLTKLMSKKSKK